MGIGANIKSARIRAGLTQAQLAEKIGVAASTITCYEKEVRLPDATKINALARALNVSGDWIIDSPYAVAPAPADVDALIEKYSKLDDSGKRFLHAVADHELERIESAALGRLYAAADEAASASPAEGAAK